MSQSIMSSDLYVQGTLKADVMVIPNTSIGDSQIDGSRPVTAAKLQQQVNREYHSAIGSVVANVTIPIHSAFAAGVLQRFRACLVTANLGGATVTVDLKKNGTTVLSGQPTLTSADAAFAFELGTFSSTVYNADDVFTIVVVAAVGGGTIGQGLTVQLITHEAAQ